MELSDKDYIILRLKCLEPFIQIASKHGIEHEIFLRSAESAWEFATKGIIKTGAKTTATQPKPSTL